MRNARFIGTIGWLLLAMACSSDKDETPGPQGASGSAGMAAGKGGATASGGVAATGGVSGGRGGSAQTGGLTGSGGVSATGGVSAGGTSSGGRPNGTGGSPSGGKSASGGAATGGTTTSGGSLGKGGSAGASGGAGNSGNSGTGGGSGGGVATTEKFSFFVTSLGGMRRLSKSEDGFGGDLRFGEATGLDGADKICRTLAEESMPGAGQKEWRAFLSTTTVNAADRVGNGPWYDRLGRLVAASKSDLLQERPSGADTAIIDDLPNEEGVPNHTDGSPGCTGNDCPDNHDTLTGSKADGTWDGGSTCDDWTSTTASGQPRVGHSWPAFSGMSWIQAHTAGGCGAGVNLVQGGGPGGGNRSVGSLGGYGGIYCFAMTP